MSDKKYGWMPKWINEKHDVKCIYKNLHKRIISKKVKPNILIQISDYMKSNISIELNIKSDADEWL